MVQWQAFWSILTASAAEFLCTLLFVLFGCGSTVKWLHEETGPSVLSISLCFGFSYAVLVNMAAPLSGGHLNPAVTLAMAITRTLSPMRAFCYVISQILGGVAGAGLLFGCVPAESRGLLGVPVIVMSPPYGSVSLLSGCVLEFFMTLVLTYTVVTCTDGGTTVAGRDAALMSGLAVTACHLFGYPVTGCGLNPARAFGPAVIMNWWTHHWVYWVGPILGACMAVGAYLLGRNFPVTTDHTLVVTGRELDGGTGSPRVKLDHIEDLQNQPATQPSRDMHVPREMKTTV